MKQSVILTFGVLVTILVVAQAQDIKPAAVGPDTIIPSPYAFIIFEEIVGQNPDGTQKIAHLEIRADKIVYLAEVQPIASASFTTSTTTGTAPTTATNTTINVPVNSYEVGNTEVWLDMGGPGDIRIVKGTPSQIGVLISTSIGSKRFK